MTGRVPKPDLREHISILINQPIAEIAKTVGRSERTVNRHIRAIREANEGPLPPGKPIRPWNDEEDAKILEFLRDGTGYAETARTFNRDHKALSRRFPGYAMHRADIVALAAVASLHRKVLN